MNQAGVLKFYDKQGALVGAYVLAQAPNPIQIVKPSAYMLGVYLFGELQNRYPETPASLVDKLNHLFANYRSSDGKPDKYQELGQYYRVSVVGSKQSHDDFLKDLHQKLEEGKPLAADLFQLKAPAVKSTGRVALQSSPSVQAGGEGGCPSGLSALATIAQAAGNFGGSILPGVALIGGVIQAGCDMAAPEDNRLSEIQSKLDEMTATLSANGLALDKLTGYVASEGANNVLKDTQTQASKANSNVAYYEYLIKGYGSFKAFVDAYGSFEKAWKKNPDTMHNLFGKFPEDWDALLLVGKSTDKGSLTRSLSLLCDGHDTPNVNIVKNRKDCNGFILNYQSLVLGTYLKHLSMLKDITETLDKYYEKEKAFIKDKVTMPSPVQQTWAKTYASVMLPKLQASLDSVADSFAPDNIAMANSKGAYFDLYAGLPTQLLEQFQTAGLKTTCTQGSSIGRQSKPVPNIISWVNTGKDSTITVLCKEDQVLKKYYSSIYYLDDGNEVLNMMGVLVSKNSPNKKTSDTRGEPSGIGGGYENERIEFPAGAEWAVFSTNKPLTDYNGVIKAGVEPDARIVYQGEFKDYAGSMRSRYYTNYGGYSKNGAGVSTLYIRYTDPSSGLSNVFAQHFWRGISSLRGSTGCLGKGCSLGFWDVQFKNGPKLEYTTRVSGNNDSTIHGIWIVKK